jgi:hypothetical protein
MPGKPKKRRGEKKERKGKIFAYKYQHGLINPSQKQVQSHTLEDAVRSVGQTFAAMGKPKRDAKHGCNNPLYIRYFFSHLSRVIMAHLSCFFINQPLLPSLPWLLKL